MTNFYGSILYQVTTVYWTEKQNIHINESDLIRAEKYMDVYLIQQLNLPTFRRMAFSIHSEQISEKNDGCPPKKQSTAFALRMILRLG